MDLYSVRCELNMGVPLTQMKLRVTDYSRVSTDHEEQKNSLKNQIIIDILRKGKYLIFILDKGSIISHLRM